MSESRETETEKMLQYFLWRDYPVTIVVDDLQLYVSKHYISNNMKDWLTVGEERQKYFIGITQRPTMIHNNFLTQSTNFIIFYLERGEYNYFFEKKHQYLPDEMKNYYDFFLEKPIPNFRFLWYDGINYGRSEKI
jgi:hypothetical protein